MKDEATQLDNQPVEIPSSTLPPPVLTYLGNDRWRLEADYMYQDGDHKITVPAGFEFDLSSVPRAFWSLIAPFELSITAPLLHDFLYHYGGDPPAGAIEPPRKYTRREADDLFRRVMEQEGVPAWRRLSAYAAVRLFGGSAWRSSGPGDA
jgi:Protein of unknown function (DUF1353)